MGDNANAPTLHSTSAQARVVKQLGSCRGRRRAVGEMLYFDTVRSIRGQRVLTVAAGQWCSTSLEFDAPCCQARRAVDRRLVNHSL